jgi:hypothetical protein
VPFAPEITCEILLSTGSNLQDSGKWCADLDGEQECGTLNYVPSDIGFKQCGFSNGRCLTRFGELVCPVSTPSPPPFAPTLDITGETLLSTGANLRHTGEWCKDRTTEAACGELNYVPAAGGLFKQCGFQSGQCSTKFGHLACPIPAASPPSLAPTLASSPSPPPFAPTSDITCETLLSTGTNLRHTGEWCKDRTTEAECGTLNYVPASGGLFKQCGFEAGQCSTKFGHLACPMP